MEKKLDVIGINKTFGQKETEVHALNDVSFSIMEQSFTAIVGKSGSGKTTLLNCIGGLETPTSGKVVIGGKDMYTMKDYDRTLYRRRHIGYVFQFFNLLSEMTVFENICVPAWIDNRQPDTDYIRSLIKFLGLEEKADTYPAQLSGGEQQRTAVARALALKPDIILADEPTGNLDKQNGKELIDLLIHSHRFYKQSILLVTHDLEIARRAQRIITLEDGCIISDTANNEL